MLGSSSNNIYHDTMGRGTRQITNHKVSKSSQTEQNRGDSKSLADDELLFQVERHPATDVSALLDTSARGGL